MDIKNNILNNNLQYEFMQGTFGLEREALRVHDDGTISLNDHPHVLGNRTYHETISTDFSEAQPELITPVSHSVDDMYRKMQALEKVMMLSLPQDEYLWTYSMPAVLPEDESLIPIVRVEDQSQITYREGLAETYGKRKQMISGMHFNFGFKKELIEGLSATDTFKDYSKQSISNMIHMKLARNFIRYRWLLTYLFGAAPTADPSFYDKESNYIDHHIRSMRSSPLGYHNALPRQVSYASIEDYVGDILGMVEDGTLSQEREFYGAARPRGTESIAGLAEKGVQYIELRSLDNNPYSMTGLTLDQLHFTHLYCLLMVWIDEDNLSTEALELGTYMNEQSGLESPDAESQYKEEGIYLLKLMQEMADELNLDSYYQGIITQALEEMEDPEKTLAYRVSQSIEEAGSLVDFGMDIARKFKKEYLKTPYILDGYEKMEMSTQMLMFDALQKGINLEVIDEEDQFVYLEHDGHEEYVQKGNKTSKDNYVSQLMMANKTVTKVVLDKHGFIVPQDRSFTSLEEAEAFYPVIADKSFVVKPKTTNYGIGITVFAEPTSQEDYTEALRIAFSEDDSVLIEEYIPGTEYRFFVVDGETRAVLLRKPAHVVGDGEHTIQELVDRKNDNPLRGTGHRSPLESLQVGASELLTLKDQGLTVEDIPEEGQTVFLRTTSNISTGGDSIDFTDQMDPSYKKIAGQISDALGATVSGIDLIIPDYQQASRADQPGYHCLEANFNPAMHMHMYVADGEGQRVTLDILNLLFPELKLLEA